MLWNKKLLLPLLVLIVAGAASYAFVFATPTSDKNDKIKGTVVVLPKEFLVNLADGRYAKLNVALVLTKGESLPSDTSKAPDGFAGFAEEAAVRDIITNVATDQNGDVLISAKGRTRIKQQMAFQINANTDVKVTEVLFTDVAVQ